MRATWWRDGYAPSFKILHRKAYPDHEDFAVRTLGMPGFGALGVTFGYTIAMDSPSGRPPATSTGHPLCGTR